MPASAMRMRRAPSNWNGLVTMPTVRMPSSLAMRAMTAAAPVPVPPPMPAAMNTMCDAGDLRADLLDRLFGRRFADLGLRAGAKTFGEVGAELNAVLGARGGQRLRVGVGDDEVDARSARPRSCC